MKICVSGLWHLGSVTAACLASLGHQVVGFDQDESVIARLQAGCAPLFEPGLDELIAQGLHQGFLQFSHDRAGSLADAELLWVTHDTPVDEDDRADADFVRRDIMACLPHLADGAVVLISSQMPVGSTRAIEQWARDHLPDRTIRFAVSPENLRLGKALDVFLKPDRILVGVRDDQARQQIAAMLAPLKAPIEWMSIESAEVSKHAINAFLAMSITFANELAVLCEKVGADAKEVERGLKTEARIGPKAYLSPGGPFAGGTLARDLIYLEEIGRNTGQALPLISSIRTSNDAHKFWTRQCLNDLFPSLAGVSIALWGLTYKAGTDTLRRSLAVDLCDWLLSQGAVVHLYDPVVQHWPERWQGRLSIHHDPIKALDGARCLVIGTPWPEFRTITEHLTHFATNGLILIDAERHLQSLAPAFGKAYRSVGIPHIKNLGESA